MTAKPTLSLICLLVPFLARADLIDTYGLLTGKTVLMPLALPKLPDSISPDAMADKTNAIAKIEAALADKGIEVIQDGPHFVRLMPRAAHDFLTNAPLRGDELASARNQQSLPKGQESLTTGSIDLFGADVHQVLDIYAALRQRTLLRPANLYGPTIRLKTQSTLSREEAVYALTTVLTLNGFCVVDDGQKFIQVVPVPERGQVKANAPKPEAHAILFDPKEVPSINPPGPTRLAVASKPPSDMERVKQEFERLKKSVYDFLHIQEPNRQSPQRLLELYARLADKKAVASTNFDRVPIFFHMDTPLTRNELMYAIETTLALNRLEIMRVGEDAVQLAAKPGLRIPTPRPTPPRPNNGRRNGING